MSKLKYLMILPLAITTMLSSFAFAEVPGECLQLPERTQICDNELYKRSPVDVPPLAIKAGEMVCICMADFSSLRIKASSQLEQIDQQVTLKRAAENLGISERDLLRLIRD